MVNRTLFSQEEEQWKPELIDNQIIATPHCSTVGNFHRFGDNGDVVP